MWGKTLARSDGIIRISEWMAFNLWSDLLWEHLSFLSRQWFKLSTFTSEQNLIYSQYPSFLELFLVCSSGILIHSSVLNRLLFIHILRFSCLNLTLTAFSAARRSVAQTSSVWVNSYLCTCVFRIIVTLHTFSNLDGFPDIVLWSFSIWVDWCLLVTPNKSLPDTKEYEKVLLPSSRFGVAMQCFVYFRNVNTVGLGKSFTE